MSIRSHQHGHSAHWGRRSERRISRVALPLAALASGPRCRCTAGSDFVIFTAPHWPRGSRSGPVLCGILGTVTDLDLALITGGIVLTAAGGIVFTVAGAIVLAVAIGLVAGAIVFAVAGRIVFAVAGAIVLAVAIVFTVAGGIVFTVAGAIVLTVAWLGRGRPAASRGPSRRAACPPGSPAGLSPGCWSARARFMAASRRADSAPGSPRPWADPSLSAPGFSRVAAAGLPDLVRVAGCGVRSGRGRSRRRRRRCNWHRAGSGR